MPRTARQSTVQLLGALMALGVIVLLVWTTTTAAFVDTTRNNGNEFATGSVVLSDDDGGMVRFNATDMAPGESVNGCILVTYGGTVLSSIGDVRFYVANATGTNGLHTELVLFVEEGELGSPGDFSDCAGFVAEKTVANATLTGAPGDYSAATAGWKPSATPESRPYRITVTLPNTATAQSSSASVDFVWEIQTTP